MEWFFTGPDMATRLDVFLDAQHRLFIGHSVETFNHLRATCAKSEDEPTIGDIVTTSRGHRHECWCSTEDVQNSGTDFYGVGFGRKVTNLTNRVSAVSLGDPHGVKTGFFVFNNFVNRGMKSTGVIEHHGQFHIFPLSYEMYFRTIRPLACPQPYECDEAPDELSVTPILRFPDRKPSRSRVTY